MAKPELLIDTPLLVCSARLLAFIRAFAAIDAHAALFPKECRTCGRVFQSFADYLRETKPKGHVLEDCSDVMRKTYTMMYRHCPCGNTLVLSVTGEIMPELEDFWTAVREEAETEERSIREVVKAFSEVCDDFIINGRDPTDLQDMGDQE
ncbi:MAG: hypothetical protein LDL33_04575 [Desulfomonile sp.]|nr:hypothetical protein [Desulfomonile sp.]